MTSAHSSSACPDGLFARARTGSLSGAEQDQFGRHLAECGDCRAMLFLSRGFDQRLAAHAADTQILARVTSRVRSARALPSQESAATPTKPRRTRVGVLLLAALLSAGVATASTVPSARALVTRIWSSIARVESAPVPVNARVRPAPAVAALPPAPAPSTPVVDPAAVIAAAPPASERSAPVTASARARSEEAPTAERLFADASARRKAGDLEGARRLYAELAKRYPRSPEAQVSRASLGRLLLERASDPAGALEQFDRLLSRSTGTMAQPALAEEALFGRATALMRLGRANEEKATWIALLGRFPGSVYAERAHERLRALK